MIFDTIINYERYKLAKPFELAFEHYLSLSIDAPIGSMELGGGVKAAIAEYMTKPADTAMPEAHRNYVDIQILLAGEELIGWYPEGMLSVKKTYDAANDIEFYKQQQPLHSSCFLPMQTGYFAIFYPWDLHMPQISVSGSAQVKKIVYKIPVESI
ncbi:MAG: YhcH/YjgK/YiaL family protein [Deferribacteraceae bacterium]|jgi:YhcH/YjgK/YiaL family protein|nr:YhcH/YjgK/YiaL family protein [Deferribacteraceae bacterium]